MGPYGNTWFVNYNIFVSWYAFTFISHNSLISSIIQNSVWINVPVKFLYNYVILHSLGYRKPVHSEHLYLKSHAKF